MIGPLLMLAGAAFVAIASIGLHRFDDVFARMHAASKASTFGLGLILLGTAIRLDDLGAAAKLGLAGAATLVTIPAGIHVIARAAWRSGTGVASHADLDERSQRRRDEYTATDSE